MNGLYTPLPRTQKCQLAYATLISMVISNKSEFSKIVINRNNNKSYLCEKGLRSFTRKKSADESGYAAPVIRLSHFIGRSSASMKFSLRDAARIDVSPGARLKSIRVKRKKH